MNFKTILNSIPLEYETFIQDVSLYRSLDEALTELGEEYASFYLQNEKRILTSLNMLNIPKSITESAETGDVQWGGNKDEVIIKKIKYKGEIIILMFDPKMAAWVTIPAFRNVVNALKYGRSLIDEKTAHEQKRAYTGNP